MVKDFIRALLGLSAEHGAEMRADADDFIALSRVSLGMESELGYEPGESAGIAFSDVDSKEFEESLEEVKSVIRHSDGPDETDLVSTDSMGTKWLVVNEKDTERLFANLQYATKAMISVNRDSRLLAAAIPFVRNDKTAYVVYYYKRGKFYPFVPKSSTERDEKEEIRISNILKEEINLEEDRSYWSPLWPRKKGLHPWE